MDEQREREVLTVRLTAWNTRLTGRRHAEGESMQRMLSKLRLIAAECEVDLGGANGEQALAVMASLGPVVEQTGEGVSVIAKGGWFRMNPVVVTCSLQRSSSVYLRAAALEGKISNRSAEKLLPKVRDMLAPPNEGL